MTLWAKRYSVAWGNRWVAEREVTAESAQQWLTVYQTDEPNVSFAVSIRKPK